MKSRIVAALVVCALLSACQSGPRPEATPAASVAVAAPKAETWMRSELFFGLAPHDAEGLGLSAAEGSWRAFLDEEVTPRFPDGFTVLKAYGQWRESERNGIERDRSRVLVILHTATPENRGRIDAIREAYKARTGEKSVLAVEIPIAAPRF